VLPVLHMCIISSSAKETYDNTYVYCVLMFMSDDTYVQTSGAHDDTYVPSCLYLIIHMCARCVCTYVQTSDARDDTYPHEKLLGILRVSNPATRMDLADRTWGGSGSNPKCRFCSR